MGEDYQSKYIQLFHDKQLSLHRYHQSIGGLLDAAHRRSGNQHFISVVQQMTNQVKDSISDIQNIQLKKLQLFYKHNPSYKDFATPLQTQPIPKVMTDFKEVKVTKPKTPPKKVDTEPLKNMASFRSNVHGEKTKIFIEEVQPLPPWRPQS
ncbi:hypothetical protein [Neobacillus sp. D3-1R]|uniref:hypothetical protein n=1 Tax=Neobacillus sp. D3-1R TaxID=3445778 RepID=UPI003FA08D28